MVYCDYRENGMDLFRAIVDRGPVFGIEYPYKYRTEKEIIHGKGMTV